MKFHKHNQTGPLYRWVKLSLECDTEAKNNGKKTRNQDSSRQGTIAFKMKTGDSLLSYPHPQTEKEKPHQDKKFTPI